MKARGGGGGEGGWGRAWELLTKADCHKQGLEKIGETLLLDLHRQHAVQVAHQIKLVTRLGGQQLQRLYGACTTHPSQCPAFWRASGKLVG